MVAIPGAGIHSEIKKINNYLLSVGRAKLKSYVNQIIYVHWLTFGQVSLVSSLNTEIVEIFTKQQKADYDGYLNFDVKAVQKINIKFVGITEDLFLFIIFLELTQRD